MSEEAANRGFAASNFYRNAASQKESLLAEVELTEENEFLDGEIHNVKIEFEAGELKVYLDQTTSDPIISVPIDLNSVLTLENGAAYAGIAQETLFTENYLEIMNWSLSSSANTFNQDKWNGLSLEYKSHWPIHLFISPEILDQYNKLFRFLFPLRRV